MTNSPACCAAPTAGQRGRNWEPPFLIWLARTSRASPLAARHCSRVQITRGVAALGKGLFRSTDSGAHWTLISDGAHGLPNSTPVSDIVGDPLNSNVLYAAVTGATGGVFKSTDTGLTW